MGHGIGRIAGKLRALGRILGIGREEISFGRSANQISHAFRHIERAGLDREIVRSAIQNDLRSVAPSIRTGEPVNQIITVSGRDVRYTAYRLLDGSINVGRITVEGQ